MRSFAIITVIFLAACAAISQQKAQVPVNDNAQFHNLQVLPPNITHDELIATMRAFSRGLGTRCNHCHVANPAGSAEEFDFASDAKPEKKAARTMLRMTKDINAGYIAKVNAHGQMVTCFTCHRGHTVPETLPAAPTPAPESPTPKQ